MNMPFTFSAEQVTELTQWADILDSTELPQCKRNLFDGVGYCCIGIYGKEIKKLYVPTFDFNDQYRSSLAESVKDSASMIYRYISNIHLDFQSNLTRLNDTGYTFKQIARYIRMCLSESKIIGYYNFVSFLNEAEKANV